MAEKTKSTEQLQALADTEAARRQRQSTIGEKYGVPPLEREEYLKMLDGKLSLVTKVVEANGVAEKEVQAFIDESKKMWCAVPRGSAYDDLPTAAILHSLSTDVMAALEVLSLPLRNGIVIGPTHEPQPDPQQISTFNDASIVERYLHFGSATRFQRR